MDPLSIISGCAGLITAIGSLSVSINTFVRSCREARSDLDRVSRELHSLQTVLELIEEDAKDDTKPFPPTIQHHVSGIVTNCGAVVLDVETCIKKYGDGRIKSKAAWAINGQGDMEKLRSSLEAHKSALELALDMLSLSLTKDIKTDTSEIRNDTAAIKDDTAMILQEIAELQARLPDTAAAQNDYILQRFLEDMATYTETTLDANVAYSDGMSSRALSIVDEHDERLLKFPGGNQPVLGCQDTAELVTSQSPDSSSPEDAPEHANPPNSTSHQPPPQLMPYMLPNEAPVPREEGDALTSPSRAKALSGQEGHHIQRFRGNVVIDLPVPDRILNLVPHVAPPRNDEFTHSRFSFITCEPHMFEPYNYTLRTTQFSEPRQTQFILVITANPNDTNFTLRWNFIHDSIVHAQQKFELSRTWPHFWKRVIVHVYIAHGTKWAPRAGGHPLNVLESIGAKQAMNIKVAKLDSEYLDKPIEEDSSTIGGHRVQAVMSEVRYPPIWKDPEACAYIEPV
ncbi:hypothetical protein LB503_000154 [Fusarium chuoi]|nr:hypothetical protein LB503_000154 [Fusarium chuoi]